MKKKKKKKKKKRRIVEGPHAPRNSVNFCYCHWNIQTLQLRSVRSGRSRILLKSKLGIHIVNYVWRYKGFQLKSKFQHTWTWAVGPWPHRSLFIAQQYSHTTFVLLCSHSCKEKFGRHFKSAMISFFIVLKLHLWIRNAVFDHLEQDWPTCGLRCVCGPPGRYLGPSLIWRFSVILFNKHNTIGLQTIIWQLYWQRKCPQSVTHHF